MIYQFNNYPYKKLKELEYETGRKPKGKKRYYKEFITFDIETTNIDEIKQGFMYVWQIYILNDYIVGRTITQLKYCFSKIEDYIQERLICFIHNLGFEFAYIRNIFDWETVFITKGHSVLRCSTKNIEFRCSYILTNMNLKEFTKRMNVKQKLSGDFYNYNKMRLDNTRLTRYEMAYILTDVKSLYHAIKKFMEYENETLYTLPLTSTGFVRRELKENLLAQVGRFYGYARRLHEEQYRLARHAFRGGNVHANRFYVTTDKTETIKNVRSFDIKSSYPFQMVSRKFPCNKWSKLYDYTEEEANRLINDDNKCFIFYLTIAEVQLKDIYATVPYIPVSKCIIIKDFNADNGRVLRASIIKIAVTDIDYKIIKRQYNFIIQNIRGMVTRASYLPDSYIKTILKYFEIKENTDKKKDPYGYARSKEKINSLYGVSVTDVIKDTIVYKNGEFTLEPITDIEYELERQSKNNPILYAIGVYVSAWARHQLQEVIDLVGYDLRYVDTDSVKFINGDKYIEHIENINDKIRRIDIDRKCVIEGLNGDVYIGVWEDEGVYKKFRMNGAKKYIYEDDEGNLQITISGVPKSSVNEISSIEDFKDGFTFQHGGTEGHYNNYYGQYKIYNRSIEITENLYLHGHEYTLGKGREYKELIDIILSGEYDNLFNLEG